MSRFSIPDVLRLEVEADPAPGQLVNLVVNPDGELGGYGWNTPIAGSVLDGFFDIVAQRWVLRYIGATDAGGSYFRTESMPMSAGQYVAGRWHYMESGSDAYRARFSFLDANGAVLSSTAYFTYNSATDDVDANTAVFQAPANTVAVRLAFEVGDPGGVYPIAIQQAHLRITDVTVAVAATSAELKTTRKNLITNPSFETNTTGWAAGAPGTLSRQTSGGAVSASCARLVSSGGFGRSVGPTIAVTAGETYTFSGYLYKSTNTGMGSDWPEISGKWNTTASGDPSDFDISLVAADAVSTWFRRSVTFTVPAGVTSVTFTAYLGNSVAAGGYMQWDGLLLEKYQATLPTTYFDGATAAAGGWTFAWDGTANASTSTASLSLLSFIQPVPYTDILGELRELSMVREELNTGTLSAVVVNPDLSPVDAATLRPGRRFRLVGRPEAPAVPGPGDPSEYTESVIVGKLSNAKVDYLPLETSPSRQAIITLTANDPVVSLANAKRSSVVAKVEELPYVLEGAGVPWICDGSSNQVASANVITTNDGAYALDQVAITRDTVGGYGWVDRRGVLRVVSSFPDPTANHIVNGSFTGAVTFVNDGTLNGWVCNSALASRTTAVPPSPSPDGGNAARMVPVGGNPIFRLAAQSDTPYTIPIPLTFYDYIPVNPGGTYRASGYLRSNVSRVAELRVTGVAEGSTDPVQEWVVPYTATPTASWGLWEIEFIVPVGISRVLLEFTWAANAAWSSNLPNTDIHWADGVSLTAVQATPYVLDETVYNPNLVVDYDTDRCINSVAVHRQWTHATSGPQETVYGPYTDAASVTEWGLHHVDITVAGTDPAAIPAFAQTILAANSQPEVRVQSLQIPINEDNLPYAYIDLYDLVEVSNTNLGISTLMRVVGVSHAMAAGENFEDDRWLMTLDFAAEGGIATPTQVPNIVPSGLSTDVPMLDMQKNGSTFSLPNAAETLITGWTINTEENVGTVAGASVVVTVPGTYAVMFQATFPAATSSRRIADIRKGSVSGTTYSREEITTSALCTLLAVHPALVCAAGDVIVGSVYQNSGGAITLPGGSTQQRFVVRRISD